jgi:hypothetical protein
MAVLTAIATIVLAVFAIFTAAYARKAFLEQSKEVRDQARMLTVQSGQLDEQRKINAEQTKVLELQARELRESLNARELQSLELASSTPQQSWHGRTTPNAPVPPAGYRN